MPTSNQSLSQPWQKWYKLALRVKKTLEEAVNCRFTMAAGGKLHSAAIWTIGVQPLKLWRLDLLYVLMPKGSQIHKLIHDTAMRTGTVM